MHKENVVHIVTGVVHMVAKNNKTFCSAAISNATHRAMAKGVGVTCDKCISSYLDIAKKELTLYGFIKDIP